jgi:hypothetical protein
MTISTLVSGSSRNVHICTHLRVVTILLLIEHSTYSTLILDTLMEVDMDDLLGILFFNKPGSCIKIALSPSLSLRLYSGEGERAGILVHEWRKTLCLRESFHLGLLKVPDASLSLDSSRMISKAGKRQCRSLC